MSDDKLPEYHPDNAPVKLTARQIALRNFLERRKSGLGAMYYGVLYALSSSRNPENIVQAAHSGRELLWKLHEAFPEVPIYASKGEAYPKLGELSPLYRANPTDRELRDKVAELDRYYDLSQINRRQRYENLIDRANQGGKPDEADKKKAAKVLLDYLDWLSSVAHHGRLNVTEDEFRKRLQAFEHMLEGLITDYYEVEKRVHDLMEKAEPDQSDLSELQRLFLRSAVSDYFFRNLANRKWLPSLKEAEYFKKPIDIVTHEDGAISCPSWAQSSLLLKCVESQPELVSEILLSVDDTSNARVHQELTEISLKLPASLAGKFAKQAKNWIRDRYHTITLLPVRLAELAVCRDTLFGFRIYVV